MKHLLLTTIAAVLVVGCGESQQSTPAPETKPAEPVAEVPSQPSPPPAKVKPVEPVAETSQPEPPTAEAPDISIHEAAITGNIEAVKKHITAGVNVNAQNFGRNTALHWAAYHGHKEIAELLIVNGADVNAKKEFEQTSLHMAVMASDKVVAEIRLLSLGADLDVEDEDVVEVT